MDNTSTSVVDLLNLTVDIVSAHVANNSVSVADMPALIGSVYASLVSLGSTATGPDVAQQEPAVAVRRSVKPEYIICLEDGKKLKMLKRHLMTHYQLTPDQYRVKWNLPADYPMVAPDYAETRRALAKKIGLGRKPGSEAALKPGSAVPKKVGRPRKKLSVTTLR
jgi:predicted transcriptional regulator